MTTRKPKTKDLRRSRQHDRMKQRQDEFDIRSQLLKATGGRRDPGSRPDSRPMCADCGKVKAFHTKWVTLLFCRPCWIRHGALSEGGANALAREIQQQRQDECEAEPNPWGV